MFREHCCCSSRSIDDETSPISTRSPEKENSVLGGSEQRLVNKVSAGMVVFTKVPNALRGKERYPMDWEMDHVNGIRLEVCSSYLDLPLLIMLTPLDTNSTTPPHEE